MVIIIIILTLYSLAVSSCSTKLYAGYSDTKIVTWVKPENDMLDDNGDYVVVPSSMTHPLPAPPTTQLEKTVQSTTSLLKYF